MTYLVARCRHCGERITRIIFRPWRWESSWHHDTVDDGMACRQLREERAEARMTQPRHFTTELRLGRPDIERADDVELRVTGR